MTLADPTGCIAGPMDRLRKCFEATSEWEEFIGNTTHDHFIFNIQDEPKDRQEFSEKELDAERPFVYLCPDYPQGFTIVSDASDGNFRSGGVVQVLIETTVFRLGSFAEISSQQKIARLWDNLIGNLLIELFYAGWNQNLLDIRRIDSLVLKTPSTITRNGQGDFVKAIFKVHWGRDV